MRAPRTRLTHTISRPSWPPRPGMRAIALSVTVFCRGASIGLWRATHVGPAGLLLQAPSSDLLERECLEVQFALPPPLDRRDVLHRIPVAAQWLPTLELALLFTGVPAPSATVLERVLHELPVVPLALRRQCSRNVVSIARDGPVRALARGVPRHTGTAAERERSCCWILAGD